MNHMRGEKEKEEEEREEGGGDGKGLFSNMSRQNGRPYPKPHGRAAGIKNLGIKELDG